MRAVILIGAVFLASATGCEQSYNFVVTDTFQGPVVVVFGDPSGISQSDEMTVSAKGTLLLSSPLSDAVFNVRRGGKDLPYRTGDREELQVFNYVTMTGYLSNCLKPEQGEFQLVSFLVGRPGDRHDWENVQRAAIREAILQSLAGRGMNEAVTCYRQKPNEIVPDIE